MDRHSNFPDAEISWRDDSPNFMSVQPVSVEDFHRRPDYYTERNEYLSHKVLQEERRQQFDNIINSHIWSNYSQFLNIVNNSSKE